VHCDKIVSRSEMHTFQSNVLIKFWFLLHVHVSNLMGSSSGRESVHGVLYGLPYIIIRKM